MGKIRASLGQLGPVFKKMGKKLVITLGPMSTCGQWVKSGIFNFQIFNFQNQLCQNNKIEQKTEQNNLLSRTISEKNI